MNYSVGKHEELLKQLVVLNVPKDLSKNHLGAINSLNNVKFAIKNMALAPTDPVKAMMGKKLYDVEIQKVYDSLKSIQDIFGKYGIYVF